MQHQMNWLQVMHPETKMLQQHISDNVATYNIKKIIIGTRSRVAYSYTKNKLAYTTQEIVTKTELVTQTIHIVHP